MSGILIIDDDARMCKTLVAIFKKMGHEAEHSLSLKKGLDKLSSGEFDVIFLDINFPDGNGLEAVGEIKKHPNPPEIIIMTGEADPEGAELAMKLKLWDYLQKTGSHKEFKFSLIRALEYRKQKQPKSRETGVKREAIIGNSRQIKTCLELVFKASNNDSSILITGETGTGKELFAKAIHENSNRKENGFVVVDCAALPEHLVESAVFGHIKGAFTGAEKDTVGLIKMADKGTLFLDEVGELPLIIQKKFLRALQEKKFRPVGSTTEISSNFRVVAATHQDLPKMIQMGQFRQDLYFRIAALKVEIPPLRDRKTDIPLLVKYHMNRKIELFNAYPQDISQGFMEDLYGYDWPGNVRELLNAIDYACSDAFRESLLFPKHLPAYIRAFNIKSKIKEHHDPESKQDIPEKYAPVETHSLKEYIEKMKYKYIIDLQSHTRGDIKTACRLSGLSMGHLYSLLKKYNIDHF